MVQKFYLKLNRSNHYGGFYVWESRDALLAFRETDLAETIPQAYKVMGAPDVDVHELIFPLHELASVASQMESA